MKISTIVVSNFRLLQKTTVQVEDRLTVVIGRNNTGKTSLLKVMRYFINGSGADFRFEDFSLDMQEKIANFKNSDLDAKQYGFDPISLELDITYNDNDDISEAAPLIMDLDDKSCRLKLRYELGLTYDDYKSLMGDFKEFDKHTTAREDGFIDYVKDNFNKYFKKTLYAVDPTDQTGENRRQLDNTFNPKRLISMAVIEAKRDVDNDGHSHTLSNLASQHYEAQDSQEELNSDLVNLHDFIRETDDKLTTRYSPIFDDIIQDIRNMSYGPRESKIKIESRLYEGNLFRDNTRVTYEQNKISLPEEYNGLGYMNLFSIVFSIRIQIDRLKKNNSLVNILFLEEPEAHTHPQMQYIFMTHIKSLLNKYAASSSLHLQTIMSSHSPQIVSQCDFNDIKYFRRTDNATESLDLADLQNRMVTSDKSNEKTKQEQAYRFVKQYITLDKAELFFSDKAILIEGDTERILIESMMKKLDDKISLLDDQSEEKKEYLSSGFLLSQDISVLEVGAYSQHFKELLDLFGTKTLVITDLDSVNANDNSIDPNLSDAVETKNTALKNFFGHNDLSYYEALKKKTLSSTDGGKTWKPDDNGKVRIAFQIPEEGSDYQTRSFEDAFLAAGDNMKFVFDNKNTFEGLKNKQRIKSDSHEFFDIADQCISSKTTFALDLLLYDGTDDQYWKTPLYIEEGLRWLQK